MILDRGKSVFGAYKLLLKFFLVLFSFVNCSNWHHYYVYTLYVGNDNLHLLTSRKQYRLRVDLADFQDGSKYAEFDNFEINSAVDKYRMITLGDYSGNAG